MMSFHKKNSLVCKSEETGKKIVWCGSLFIHFAVYY